MNYYSKYPADDDTTQMTNNDSEITSIKGVKKVKPIHLMFEYKFKEKSALTFSFLYNNYASIGGRIDSVWNPNSLLYSVTNTDLFYSMNRFRFMFGYSKYFHLKKNDRFTFFINGSLGYNLYVQRYFENMNIKNIDESGFAVSDENPFSLLFLAGMNYKIKPKFELVSSVGIGGPLFSIGLKKTF
jgi:hypothetical protein